MNHPIDILLNLLSCLYHFLLIELFCPCALYQHVLEHYPCPLQSNGEVEEKDINQGIGLGQSSSFEGSEFREHALDLKEMSVECCGVAQKKGFREGLEIGNDG